MYTGLIGRQTNTIYIDWPGVGTRATHTLVMLPTLLCKLSEAVPTTIGQLQPTLRH